MKKVIRIMLCILCLCCMYSGRVVASGKAPGTEVILKAGKTFQLSVGKTKKKVKWYSSNKKVATVSSKGRIRAKRKGSATIIARIGNKKYSWRITVVQPVKRLVVNKKNLILKGNGSSYLLKVKIRPSNADNKKLLWSSSNNKVATVNADGRVIAVGNGRCVITAKTLDGSGKKAVVKVTVKKAATSKRQQKDVNKKENPVVITITNAENEEKKKSSSTVFDLSLFPETVIISQNSICSLFVSNLKPVNPLDVSFQLTGTDVMEIPNFIQREKEVNPCGFISGVAYYAGGWEKRTAYVEAGHNPYGYAPFRVDIYPFLSCGTFTVELYYQGKLIARCYVVMNTVDPQWCQLEKLVKYCENQSWTYDMTKEEKLNALADYVRNNMSYEEADCKAGVQIMFCGAKDLGYEATLGFEAGNVKSYDYRSVATPIGHTWCEVYSGGINVRFDVQGN